MTTEQFFKAASSTAPNTNPAENKNKI
jgi:hypothetical protein